MSCSVPCRGMKEIALPSNDSIFRRPGPGADPHPHTPCPGRRREVSLSSARQGVRPQMHPEARQYLLSTQDLCRNNPILRTLHFSPVFVGLLVVLLVFPGRPLLGLRLAAQFAHP